MNIKMYKKGRVNIVLLNDVYEICSYVINVATVIFSND